MRDDSKRGKALPRMARRLLYDPEAMTLGERTGGQLVKPVE
jgi:hypothetical protein